MRPCVWRSNNVCSVESVQLSNLSSYTFNSIGHIPGALSLQWNICPGGGGALNFGLRVMCHQKDPTFFCPRFHRKTPIFYQLLPNDPHLSKISTFLTKCWEIFGHFGPESPYFLMHFTERPPISVRFVTERPPFLTQFVTGRPLHLWCLVAVIRHFNMWVPLREYMPIWYDTTHTQTLT